jgi:hypothetical protein
MHLQSTVGRNEASGRQMSNAGHLAPGQGREKFGARVAMHSPLPGANSHLGPTGMR